MVLPYLYIFKHFYVNLISLNRLGAAKNMCACMCPKCIFSLIFECGFGVPKKSGGREGGGGSWSPSRTRPLHVRYYDITSQSGADPDGGSRRRIQRANPGTLPLPLFATPKLHKMGKNVAHSFLDYGIYKNSPHT